jgi:hypothetical protein
MAKMTKAAARKRLVEAEKKILVVMWKPWSGSQDFTNAQWKDCQLAINSLRRVIKKMK